MKMNKAFLIVWASTTCAANYTLLRAAGYIKDNRIPPERFTTTHPSYDSTAIEGLAASDPNFNISNGVQGSGVDTVTYRIGGLDPANAYNVSVKLLYQTHAPRFVDDLFQYSTPEVEQGQKSIPGSPFLVQMFPNPFNPNTTIEVVLKSPARVDVGIYDLSGKKIRTIAAGILANGKRRFTWDARDQAGQQVASGQYFVQVVFKEQQTGKVYRQIKKTMFLK